MSEQPTTGNSAHEIPGLDETVSPAERDTRIAADEGDDLPVTPPESQPRATERQMAGLRDEGETIEQRIAQEEPDPHSAYGAPVDESGLDGVVDEPVDERSYAGQPPEEAAMHVIDGAELTE